MSKQSHSDRPSTCPICDSDRLVIEVRLNQMVRMSYEGKSRDVLVPELPVLKCSSCGEAIMDSQGRQAMDLALRTEVGLLAPTAINSYRKRLGLNRAELAKRIGAAAETLSRVLTGKRLQSVMLDRMMRVYFASSEARSMFDRLSTGDLLETEMEMSTQRVATALSPTTSIKSAVPTQRYLNAGSLYPSTPSKTPKAPCNTTSKAVAGQICGIAA